MAAPCRNVFKQVLPVTKKTAKPFSDKRDEVKPRLNRAKSCKMLTTNRLNLLSFRKLNRFCSDFETENRQTGHIDALNKLNEVKKIINGK
jgi:hypothetical protein